MKSMQLSIALGTLVCASLALPAAAAPTADSVTPNSGSGLTQNFTFKFSNPTGYANLGVVYTLINGGLSAAGGCIPYYVPASNSIYLFNDAGNAVTGPLIVGTGGALSNSQCSIDAGQSSANGSGNTLTLTLAITFNSSFKGTQTIFGYAADNASGNSGWQTLGTWTPSGGGAIPTPPSADSVSPQSGSGANQTFTFLYSSVNGYQYIADAYALINSSLSAAGGCIPYYVQSTNSLYLFNDAGNGAIGPVTPGSAGTLSNSQCTINAAGSTVSGANKILALKLAISFKPAFAGDKKVYGAAIDAANLNSGWQTLGVWNTSGSITPLPPTADSVTPASGSGASQTFTFKFSSSNGYQYVTSAYMLINSSLNAAAGCVPVYLQQTNAFYLFNDAGTNVSGPLAPGSNGTLSNGQCTINGAGSSVSGSGNTLSVVLPITFSPSFKGAQTVFGYAGDAGGMNSGWRTLGTWTPTAVGPAAPTADSVTPASGSGASQVFTFKYSSPSGFANLSSVYALFNTSVNAAAGCVPAYLPGSNALYLFNDAGTGLLGPITPGGAGSVSNSQCTITGAGLMVSGSGTTLSLTLPIAFTPAFKGNETIFGYASDKNSLNSGWQTLGTWTTSAPTANLAGVSVSPSSVTGGSPSTGTVTLVAAAGANGVLVNLSSNSPSATVPASITIAAGQTTGNFTVNTAAVNPGVAATITATSATTVNTTLTIVPTGPVPAALAGISVTPNTATGGSNVTGTVTLASAAGPNGVLVTFSSNNGAAIVPATIVVGSGQTSASFNIGTAPVLATQVATITASSLAAPVSANLTINPSQTGPGIISSVSVSPNPVTGGSQSTGTVFLTTAAGASGVPVTITSNNAAAQVANIVIGPGQSSGTFLVNTSAVSATQIATITAMAANTASTSLVITTAQSPQGLPMQQGPKLVAPPTTTFGYQGTAVALSADGNTMIVGAKGDNSATGAGFVWIRNNGVWTLQSKLVGSGASGSAVQGFGVALSADGNTALVGGPGDNADTGATWVFVRSNGVWTQQGPKLVGSGAISDGDQGYALALSADGNTAAIGGNLDNGGIGAVWIWTRSGGVWTQQGGKLIGSGALSTPNHGYSVALSADGNTLIEGAPGDNNSTGAAWIWTRSGGAWTQQGPKLIGDAVLGTGNGAPRVSVAISADGNTALFGRGADAGDVGAVWVFTRTGGTWSQPGPKLVGSDSLGAPLQGSSVAISGDGNMLLAGGPSDNGGTGAVWVWRRVGGVWTQQGSKLVGTGGVDSPNQGYAVALSLDATTAAETGVNDSNHQGAAWVFTNNP